MMELLNEFLSGSVAWGVLLTLAAFALGALVNRVTGKAFFNPLLLGAIFVIVFLSVCGIPYADYKVSAAPVNYLLLPATVAPPPSSRASRWARWSAWAARWHWHWRCT